MRHALAGLVSVARIARQAQTDVVLCMSFEASGRWAAGGN